MSGLLNYAAGNSFLHRLNPTVKLFCAFFLCASCFITGKISFALLIILFNLCLSLASGWVIFGRAVKILFSLMKLSVVLFLIQILFIREGEILFIILNSIIITKEGLDFSLLFVLRLIAATMPLSLVLSITRMSDISASLTRTFGIPYKYAFALTSAMRFIPLFSTEMAGIKETQMARGIELDTKNFFKKIKLFLPLCAPLLISSVRKIEGGAISAELRGFNFRTRKSGWKKYPFTFADFLALALCISIIVLSVFY
ncbi:MAG: energy-coupling factor transporter transmembrane protein EcfT [Treponema sp.]|nr:energy-coupling factor transporter transmembrane protein EcfT [Treponema sp.]